MKKIKSGKLTYVQNIIVHQKRYYEELSNGSHCHWEPNMSQEQIEEITRDWREENVFKWQWAKMMKLKYANKNEISHFIFKENQIKLERESLGKGSDLQNEFNLIDRDSFCSVRFYEDKEGNAKKTVMNIGTTHQELWNVDFFIKKEKNITKKILGFDCYKVLITELKFIDKKLSLKHYEMFVTPEIQFPAHCAVFLNGFTIEECPLEIKSLDDEYKAVFELQSAIKFEAYDTSSEFILPEKYEVIRNDMNLEIPYNYKKSNRSRRSNRPYFNSK